MRVSFVLMCKMLCLGPCKYFYCVSHTSICAYKFCPSICSHSIDIVSIHSVFSYFKKKKFWNQNDSKTLILSSWDDGGTATLFIHVCNVFALLFILYHEITLTNTFSNLKNESAYVGLYVIALIWYARCSYKRHNFYL